MSNYAFQSHLSYHDYLQARSFENSIRSEIAASTRALIASNEELQREHVTVSRTAASNVTSSLGGISEDLEHLSIGLRDAIANLKDGNRRIVELRATFEWGFSEILRAVGHLSDSLEDLIVIAKTPAQTWAYEQFEIARDAARQDLYQEALEYLDRAINGFAGNTGYKLEYRFHYLLGVIKIGSFKNHARDVLNPPEAEKAFLTAARYAQRDQPLEAGRAMLGAGWAAYVQGDMDRALQHLQQSTRLHPRLAEAHFTLAKVLMHIDTPGPALQSLRAAIEFDRMYMIKAGGDDNFKKYEEQLVALFSAMRQEAQRKAEEAMATARQEFAAAERAGVQEFTLRNYASVDPASQALDAAAHALGNDTYFGYLDALSNCGRARKLIADALAEFSTKARAEASKRVNTLEYQISQQRNSGLRTVWVLVMVVGIFGFLTKGCMEGLRVEQANSKQQQVREEAEQKMLQDVRRSGYDPDRLTLKEGAKLGFRLSDLPPRSTSESAFGTWLSYVFFGSLLSIGVAVVGNKVQTEKRVFRLTEEHARLKRILAQFDVQHSV